MLPKKAEEMEAPCKAALCPSSGKFIPLCISLGHLWGYRAQTLTTTTECRNGVSSHQLPQGSGDRHKMAVGDTVLSGRETVEAQPHSWWPWGRKEAGGWQGPGDRAPPQLAALSIVAWPRQPCLHPNNVPSVQRPRPGTCYLVFLPPLWLF